MSTTPTVTIRHLGPVTYRRRWWHLWTSRGEAWALTIDSEPPWARPPVFGTRDDAEAAARRLAARLVRPVEPIRGR